MKYKRIAITALVIFLLGVLIILYFCFSSFSLSYGYKHSWNDVEYIEKDRITVIIDPGHGGIDPGAVSGGIVEKELNLAVALKLGDFLKMSDVNVVFTRKEDILLGGGETVKSHKNADLKERLAILENTENAILVSIHMNKFSMESVHGLQTFYADSVQGSSVLAGCIQEASKLVDSANNRTIKPDDNNIYILENATKTAVLVECGFISNPKEAELLSSDEYQNKLAFAIYTGIIKFLQENEL